MAERLMKTVFDWEHFAIYLSGPMDYADDGGRGWRENWTEKLTELGINPKQIYNPCDKPFNGTQFDLNDEAKLARECRKEKNWDGLDEIMSQVVHVDLRLVDKSDIILVNFPRMPRDIMVEANLEHYEYNSGVMVLLDSYRELYNKYRSLRVPTYGTMHEIVVARQQRKPVFVVWEDTGKSDCSSWLMRLVGSKNVFSNVNQLMKNLSDISKGHHSFNANEWLLLDPK